MQLLTDPMSELEEIGVQIEKIVESYQENEVMRATIDYLASRLRDPRNSETKAQNLKWELRNRGRDFPLDDVIEVLEVLGDLGCGTFQRGRPKEASRLNWEVSVRDMAEAVKDEAGSVDEVASEADEAAVEVHYFPVRKGVQQELRLRADMTPTELDNLADFVKIIAASRRNSTES